MHIEPVSFSFVSVLTVLSFLFDVYLLNKITVLLKSQISTGASPLDNRVIGRYLQAMTKKQEFKVLEKFSDFEIRQYEPCVIAEVKVSAQYSAAPGIAFASLFNYISKGNNSSEKIAMTAPVIAANRSKKSADDEWFVSFVMPSGSTYGHLPRPHDPQVVLRELDAETCIAASFRGRATDERSRKQIALLREAAKRENIALSDETRICRFDPPFKPSFMQYNEIVIPIYLAAQ